VLVGDDVALLVQGEVGLGRREQRVRARPDRDHHHLALDHELGARDRDGAAPAGRVGLAQLHPDAPDPRDPAVLVADHLQRRDLQLEADPFLLGVVDLLHAGGELGHAAPVDDRRLVGAEPLGGPHGVYRDVPAAHDHDPVAA